jgi:hypothetical protein
LLNASLSRRSHVNTARPKVMRIPLMVIWLVHAGVLMVVNIWSGFVCLLEAMLAFVRMAMLMCHAA